MYEFKTTMEAGWLGEPDAIIRYIISDDRHPVISAVILDLCDKSLNVIDYIDEFYIDVIEDLAAEDMFAKKESEAEEAAELKRDMMREERL